MTIVEITRSSVRVFQGSGQGRGFKLKRCVVEPVAPPSDTAAQLARLLRQAGAEREAVIATIPREQVITRLLKLPSTRPDELARMVELSGRAQLPYPPEQAVVDFQVIEEQSPGSLVQLVACQRELVEQLAGLLQRAGVESARIVPNSWGLVAWHQHVRPAPSSKAPALIINIDSDHTDLVIGKAERLMYSRSLAQGLTDWQAGDAAVAAIALEIERSLSGLRKELPGIDVGAIVLTGLGSLEAWQVTLSDRLGRPVTVRPMLGTPPAASLDPAPAVSVAAGLGLGLAEARDLPNLLPQTARVGRVQRQRANQLRLTGILAVMAAAGAVGISFLQVQRQHVITEELTRQVHELESLTSQTEQRQRQVVAVQGVLAGRVALGEMLAELFRLTPPSILLETMTVEMPRREVAVRGNAPTTRDALDFIRILEESGRFERVQLRYSSQRTTRTGARTEFEFLAVLKPIP